MPASRHSSRSPCIASLVIAIIRGRACSFARPSCTDAARGLVTVHFRHLHVEKDDIVLVRLERSEHFGPGGDHVDVVPEALQQPDTDRPVDDVVVGKQQPEWQSFRQGPFESRRRWAQT